MTLKSIAIAIYKHLPSPLQKFVNRRFTPSFAVAAKVYVTNPAGQFLAVKQSYRPGWDIPGGFTDRNETPDQSAKRELWEETGLELDNLVQHAVIFEPKHQMVQVIFTAAIESSPTLTPDGVEITQLRWVDEKDVELCPIARETVWLIKQTDRSYHVTFVD